MLKAAPRLDPLKLQSALYDAPPLARDALSTFERVNSDYSLNPAASLPKTLKSAAVLVPVVNRTDGPTILLTKRTSHLRKHAGQVSFPGGRVDETDTDARHTALRETEEEIGLPTEAIQISGYLDRYMTGTGFDVMPVVGWIDQLPNLRLNEAEVDHTFELPLSYILDVNNRQQRTVMWQGELRRYYVYDYQRRYIWGATAGMLSNFAEKLCATPALMAALKK